MFIKQQQLNFFQEQQFIFVAIGLFILIYYVVFVVLPHSYLIYSIILRGVLLLIPIVEYLCPQIKLLQTPRGISSQLLTYHLFIESNGLKLILKCHVSFCSIYINCLRSTTTIDFRFQLFPIYYYISCEFNLKTKIFLRRNLY